EPGRMWLTARRWMPCSCSGGPCSGRNILRDDARARCVARRNPPRRSGVPVMMASMTDRTVTFDTALGRCAVSWSDLGITGVWLPRRAGYSGPAMEDVGDVPAFVRGAVDGMRAVLAGERRDLHPVPLDERGLDPFRRSVHAATRDIEPGTTQTYGQVA